jgi:hypothetical protein
MFLYDEMSDSKDMHNFSLVCYSYSNYYVTIILLLLRYVPNVVCNLHYQMLFCINTQNRMTTGIAVC